jgi:hypothetical protein
MFIAFDLLARGERDLQTSRSRRAAQNSKTSCGGPRPVHVTRTTGDHDLATQWLARFEAPGWTG